MHMPTRSPVRPALVRIPRREDAFNVPRPLEGAPGRFLVDATWGTIRPIELAPGVRTVGELEVILHLEHGLPVIDSRPAHAFAAGSIPGAANVPHAETSDRLAAFDRDVETVLFCNGPQCGATPDAVATLLECGYPAERILYYRGGLHDWLTLGLPVTHTQL